MTERLFRREELDHLELSGRARVLNALEDDHFEAQKIFDHVIGLYRRFHNLYHGWTASLFGFLQKRYGHEAASRLTTLDSVLAGSDPVCIDSEKIRVALNEPSKSFARYLENSDVEGARNLFLSVEHGCLSLHDFYRDYVTSILSGIYREYGIDVLADSLRASSEKDWMPWMIEEVDNDPRERLTAWADLLAVGNFSTIAIEEHEDRFVMTQNPCGSCGRQYSDGRYDPPWDLAIVHEKHPITYEAGETTVYRSHIPMMHYIMPVERIGAPWPLIQCPHTKEGTCKITFFKNARQPVSESEARWSNPYETTT